MENSHTRVFRIQPETIYREVEITSDSKNRGAASPLGGLPAISQVEHLEFIALFANVLHDFQWNVPCQV